MINKLPCTYLYITDTKVGERNQNFFYAINHLRQLNREASQEEILEEALRINESFNEKLEPKEVQAVVHHVCNTLYYSSCHKFKKYCRHCKYGSNRKPFKETIPNLWKILNKDNTLKNGVVGLPRGCKYYLWDIIDTSQLNDDDRLMVMKLRENKGINPEIDKVIKLRGFPVGDEALGLFMNYLND